MIENLQVKILKVIKFLGKIIKNLSPIYHREPRPDNAETLSDQHAL